MKILKFAVIAFFVSLFFSSCTVRYVDSRTGLPIGRQGGGVAQGGQTRPGERSLKPYYAGQKPAGKVQTGTKQVQTGTKKKEIAYFEAQLWDSEDEGLKQQATDFAARYFEKHSKSPSNEEVSEAVGHRCQVRRIR